MPTQVLETPIAAAQAAGLRGPAKRAYNTFLDDLAAQGCAAMGYRLTGPNPLSHLCVKHLRGRDRVVVAFTDDDHAWVPLVAPHVDEDPGRNVYDMIYELAAVRPEDLAKRTKPTCCAKDSGGAPTIDLRKVDELVDNARRIAVGRRHRSL